MSSTKYGSLPTSSKFTPTRISEKHDDFNPSYDAPERNLSESTGVITLLNTMVGGGTLSLPYIFRKCGVVMATIFIILAMGFSMFSMRTLCTLARKEHCYTYSDVMAKAFGIRGHQLTTVLLFVLLVLVSVAFLVLLRDITGEVLEFVTHKTISTYTRNFCLCLLALFFYPLMSAHNLHVLRYASYCGTSCITMLLLVMIIKTTEEYRRFSPGAILDDFVYTAPDTVDASMAMSNGLGVVKLFSLNTIDIFTGLSIIFVAFLCQFNVLGIYSQMIEPSEEKINRVIGKAITIGGFLFFLFGLVGYLYAFDRTQGNILNNFASRDPDLGLLVARVGLMTTLLLQLPMVMVPCRQSLLLLLFPDKQSDMAEPVWLSRYLQSYRMRERFMRYAVTGAILFVTLIIAMAVPGVALVWSIVGSTVGLMIAFLLPSLAYICIWQALGPARKTDHTVLAAYGLLIISSALIVLCTAESVSGILDWK